MKEIKALKDFSIDGKFYFKDDVITDLTIEQINRLNEKGYIEPLTFKELVTLEKEMKKPKKEVKDNGVDTR